MPDRLTDAIDALASGQRPHRRAGAARAARDHGAATRREAQTAALPDRAAHEGRDGRRARRAGARRCASWRTPVRRARDDLLDTAGTGGGRPTFNVSTTAALVAAGAGCAVAKHGNRSATEPVRARPTCSRRSARASTSSRRRSRTASTRSASASCSRPRHHPATRYVVPVRKELGGAHDLQLPRPADQPGRRRAPADRRLRPRATSRRIAGALARLGAERALVVSGADGLDEVSIVRRRRAWSRSTATSIDALHGRAGGRRARAARRRTRSAAATPDAERRDHARGARRRAGPASATLARAERGRGDLRRRPRRTRSREGVRAARARRSTRAPRRERSSASCAQTRGAGAAA